jgi:hypothetical protein
LITLKKLKIIASMSEETTAFTAEVHFNGKLVGFAKNSGRGGCTDVDPAFGKDESKSPAIRAAFAEAEAWAKTQPDKLEAELAKDPRVAAIRASRGETTDPNPKHNRLDSYIDELVYREDQRKQRSGYITRSLRKATAAGYILGYRGQGTDMTLLKFPDSVEGVNALKQAKPELVNLAGLSPADAVAKVDAAYPL